MRIAEHPIDKRGLATEKSARFHVKALRRLRGHYLRLAFVVTSVLCATIFACRDAGVSSPPDQKPTVILTTTVAGPGGPGYMRGALKNCIAPDWPATNVHLFLLAPNDYADTLLHVFVNSTDGTFLITQLPTDTVDMIVVGATFLSAKISGMMVGMDHNSFAAPRTGGLWVDSTLFLTAVADSVPRPNMPLSGVLGYTNALGLRFKSGVAETEALMMIAAYPSDTIRVVPDIINGDTYFVIYSPSTNYMMAQRLLYFNWLTAIREAGSILTSVM